MKKKISEKEKKLRTFLREEQARLRRIAKEIENNPSKWKFGNEGGGKKTLEINSRIAETKEKLKKFGYKGSKPKIIKIPFGEKVFEDNLGNAWDKKAAIENIFDVIQPEQINGYWVNTQFNQVMSVINGLYNKMTSRNSLKIEMDEKGIAVLYLTNEKQAPKRTIINND